MYPTKRQMARPSAKEPAQLRTSRPDLAQMVCAHFSSIARSWSEASEPALALGRLGSHSPDVLPWPALEVRSTSACSARTSRSTDSCTHRYGKYHTCLQCC